MGTQTGIATSVDLAAEPLSGVTAGVSHCAEGLDGESCGQPRPAVPPLTQVTGERRLEIAMLSDRFEVVVPSSTKIGDVRAALRQDRIPSGMVTFLLGDGQAVPDDQLVQTLPQGTILCCCVTSLAALEARFAGLESPGCPFQKYLRSYLEVPADDPRVLRTFYLFAILAPTAEKVFSDRHAPDGDRAERATMLQERALPVNQVAGAVLMLLDKVWCGERPTVEFECGGARGALSALSSEEAVTEEQSNSFQNMSAEELEPFAVPFYSMEAHERLLCWASSSLQPGKSGQVSKHLRVAMAELDQIICRCTPELLEAEPLIGRKTQAYLDLLKILAGGRSIRCWA